MAVRVGNHVTTWVSGTASIVNAETVHKGDAMKQTEQTLTNIEKLIAPKTSPGTDGQTREPRWQTWPKFTSM
jgi:hypothetical protein